MHHILGFNLSLYYFKSKCQKTLSLRSRTVLVRLDTKPISDSNYYKPGHQLNSPPVKMYKKDLLGPLKILFKHY